MSEGKTPRVFVSYSHDSPAHSKRVLALALALRGHGINVELDQFHGDKILDWPRWCHQQISSEQSDFVLCVSTAEYNRRIEGHVPPEKGRGVYWEGNLLDDELYDPKGNSRLIPLLFDAEPESSIPRMLRGWTCCRLQGFALWDGGYEHLLRLLTGQARVKKTDLGQIPHLPPDPVPIQEGFSVARDPKPIALPYATLGESFVGRRAFLDDLRQRFQWGRDVDPPYYPNHLIYGIGGVGKTRAAIEYAIRFQDGYSALLFVNGETESDLEYGLANLAGVLAPNLPPESTDPDRRRAVQTWLNGNPGWLLIVDNVDDQQARNSVNVLLKEWHQGHVLITGRHSDWGNDVQSLELGVLAALESQQFLLKRTEDRRQLRVNDAEVAQQIAINDLGQLCLALEQATAYIRHRQISFEEYRRRWQAKNQQIRGWADKVLMKYHEEKAVSLSIATTWTTSVDQLSADAHRLLDMLSWLAPDPLPQTIFTAIEQTGILSETELLLAELRSFSLLQRVSDASCGTIPFDLPGQMHRLVQLITREQLDESKESQSKILLGLSLAAAEDPADVQNWSAWNLLQPHVAAILQHADGANLPAATSLLLSQLGTLLFCKAHHADAESLMRRALAIDEQTCGADHPNVAIDLNNLAQLLQQTNRLAEAEPLMRRALLIDEQTYAAEHPNVAIDLNNLAALLLLTNRLTEAEPLMRRALAINEQSYGSEHPNVAIHLSNLAQLFQAISHLAEAEPLMRRALAIDEQSYGKDHPRVATDLDNLAHLLRTTNRLGEAEPLIRRALAIDEQSHGAEHPNVASRLNNLAQLLKATNRLAEAEPLMRRALAIDERSFGAEHPNVARDLSNLAALLFQATNRVAEAEFLMRRALAIDEQQAYGTSYPNVAIHFHNLAQLLRATNRLSEAEPLMRRCVAIYHEFGRATGHEHPYIQSALSNYRRLLSRMKLGEAEIDKRLLPFLQSAPSNEERARTRE